MSSWKDLAGSTRRSNRRGAKAVRKLLDATLPAFASHCRRYFDHTNELPFIYSEKQLHSILVPAFTDIAEVVFREQPIRRDQTSPSVSGWVDYWLERKNKVFLLELKHGFLNASTGKLTTEEAAKWTVMEEQLASNRAVALPDLLEDPDKAHVVGVFVMVHYVAGDRRDQSHAERAACWKRHMDVVRSLDATASSPASVHALWMVPRDMQFTDWTRTAQTFPAVSFLMTELPGTPAL